MKHYHLFLASMILLALCACSRETSFGESGEEVNTIQVIGPADIVFEEPATRGTEIINGSTLRFSWAMGDSLGIFPNKGNQVEFPITSTEGGTSAEFDGGGWGLKNGSSYAAYYPFSVWNYHRNNKTILLDYTGQVQDGNGSFAHLSAHDYLASSRETPESGKVTFVMSRLGAILYIDIVVPVATTVNSLVISCGEEIFTENAALDISGEDAVTTPTKKSKTLTLEFKNTITTAANETVRGYMAIYPLDFSGKTVYATLNTEAGEFGAAVVSKEVKQGKATFLRFSEGFHIEPEMVDLGLPSGIKWASFNLGATKPEEYGDYYAWGETEPYYVSLDPLLWKDGKWMDGYYWPSYTWCMGATHALTKYCWDSSSGYNGFTDDKTVLDPEDDAAQVNLGVYWRMPTNAEWQELIDNCIWTWTTQNGVNGMLVTASNGNSIFLPAAGGWTGTGLNALDSGGSYWSSSLSSDYSKSAWEIDFDSNVTGRVYYTFRCYGSSIRPVYAPVRITGITLNKTAIAFTAAGETDQLTATVAPSDATISTVTWSSSDNTVATVRSDGTVTAVGDGTATIIVTANDGSGVTAECKVTVGNIVFADENVKTICVDNWDTNGDGELSYVEAAAVTSIGTVFKSKTNITSFDEFRFFTGVTSIGGSAFSGCSGLTSINIPDSVTSIWQQAFDGCSGLTSINIPDSVTGIGSYAFRNCTNLENATISKGIKDLYGLYRGYSLHGVGAACFYGCRNLKSVVFKGTTSINGNAFTDGSYDHNQQIFTGCIKLESIEFCADTPVEIGSNAFSGLDNIKQVVSKSGFSAIGSHAFEGCSSLEGMGIITGSIREYAFRNCSGLSSISIGDGMTSIGYYAFDGCSGLTRVDITNLEAWCNISFSGSFSQPCYYAHHLYLNGTELTEVSIPSTIDNIKSYSFAGCSGLTSINIPDNVTSIGDGAFQNCSGLTSISIPAGVTIIGDYAFSGCSGLTSISIPAGVTSIGVSAFSGCNGLTSINIPDSVTSIGQHAFSGCSGLTSINIPDGVTSIGQKTFSGCSSLTTVTIGDGVTSIGEGAFQNCSGLTSISIPAGVTSIGGSAFSGCSGLTSITIGDGVTIIGDYAFSGCSGLTRVDITNLEAWCSISFSINSSQPCYYAHHLYLNGTELTEVSIPSTIDNIKSRSFAGCSGLTSITIGDGVTIIGDYAFDGCSGLTNVTIGDGVTSIGGGAFQKCSGLTSISIPAGVTIIGDYAFSGCSGLTSISIPAGVTSIGVSAFSGCNGLTSINIPDSVTSIGQHAFSGCSGLTSINIPDSVTSIGQHAFYRCGGLTSITIGDGVTIIGDYAFSGCSSATRLSVGSGTTSIGARAFYKCNSLQTILIYPLAPPSLGDSSVFTDTGSGNIYVPSESLETYKNASGWNSYSSRLVGM